MAAVARAVVVSPLQAGPLRLGPMILALAVGAAAWELASRLLEFPFQPSLVPILQAAWRMTVSGEIPGSVAASAGVLAIGYGLAALVGVTAGLALGRYESLAVAFDPYVDALLATPNLLLVLLFFGMLGTGSDTQIAVVFVYSFAAIVTMTRSGLAASTREYVDMARVFGASESQIFRRVLLPGALPTIMAGLRLGLSRAVRALIGAEMLIGSLGLGALIRRYGHRFDAASVYGILIVLVALVLAANYAMHLADRRLNRWTLTSS